MNRVCAASMNSCCSADEAAIPESEIIGGLGGWAVAITVAAVQTQRYVLDGDNKPFNFVGSSES